MASPILIVAVILFFLFYFYKYATARPKGFPPGPPRIPIFGSYLFFLLANPKYLHKAALFLSKLYKSPVIGLYLGQFPAVISNSYSASKEILTRTEFDGRADIFAARLRDPEYKRNGIFFVDGPQWKDQRRFVLRYLRDFGFGRRFNELEAVMNEEITEMIDMIRNGPKYRHEKGLVRNGEIFLPSFFTLVSTNGFLHIMCNERVPRKEHKELLSLFENAITFQRTGDDYGRLLSLIPWIRFFFPNISGFKTLRDSNKGMYDFFKKIVDRHIETYDESHERNFIDVYIKKMREETNEETYFKYDQFVLSMVDFALPAITAVPSQLSILMQWFLLRPDIQKRIQEEIDEVVGSGRLPTLDDRINLPFTEAAMRECLRIETLVPSGIPHAAMVDTTLMGYQIPAGCVTVAGLHAMHTDEEIWGDPEYFRPERFLDENGKLSLVKDVSFPFGAGKRLCAGETYARNTMFLIVAAFCQNFNIVLKPGQRPPDLSKNLNGIIMSPKDFWVKVESR